MYIDTYYALILQLLKLNELNWKKLQEKIENETIPFYMCIPYSSRIHYGYMMFFSLI